MRSALFALVPVVWASGACTTREQAPARDSAAATATVVTGRVPLADSWLYYESVGSGTPVVLIQGGNLALEMWDEQVAALSPEFRVIRYDTRAFGKSGPYAGPYAAHHDLLTLLDSLGVRRAHLVGLSLGGRIAVDFALMHPDRVGAIVLAGAGLSGYPWTAGDTSWVMPIWNAIKAKDSIAAADAWLATPYMVPAMEDSARAARLRVLARANASHWLHPDSERVIDPPAMKRLGELRVPVLTIVGSRDHPDIRAIADSIGAHVPGVRKVVFEGAGHMLNLERVQEFNRTIVEFFRSTLVARPE